MWRVEVELNFPPATSSTLHHRGCFPAGRSKDIRAGSCEGSTGRRTEKRLTPVHLERTRDAPCDAVSHSQSLMIFADWLPQTDSRFKLLNAICTGHTEPWF